MKQPTLDKMMLHTFKTSWTIEKQTKAEQTKKKQVTKPRINYWTDFWVFLLLAFAFVSGFVYGFFFQQSITWIRGWL